MKQKTTLWTDDAAHLGQSHCSTLERTTKRFEVCRSLGGGGGGSSTTRKRLPMGFLMLSHILSEGHAFRLVWGSYDTIHGSTKAGLRRLLVTNWSHLNTSGLADPKQWSTPPKALDGPWDLTHLPTSIFGLSTPTCCPAPFLILFIPLGLVPALRLVWHNEFLRMKPAATMCTPGVHSCCAAPVQPHTGAGCVWTCMCACARASFCTNTCSATE